jgi:hypothetical protein
MNTFFIKDLIQLYCLRHVSNNQVFIIRKSIQTALRYFFMHPYKQSRRCQNLFDTFDAYVYIYVYNALLYLVCTYILVYISVKIAFVRITNSSC